MGSSDIRVGRSVRAGRDVVLGDRIEHLVIHLHDKAPPLVLDDEALEARRREYLARLPEFYGGLDFKGIRLPDAIERTAGLQLADVYVPVRARLDSADNRANRRIAGRLLGEAETVDDEEPPEEDFATLIRESPALVVLGDPGAGKSTLLKFLTLKLARSPGGVVPILVPLAAYSRALEGNSELSLTRFLADYYESRFSSIQGFREFFARVLRRGRAVILLDGLDEVVAGRGHIVERVDALVRDYLPPPERMGEEPGNRVLVTSRFVGYREAPLSDPRWRTLALVDWELGEDKEPAEIEIFVERFTRAVEVLIAGSKTEQAERQAGQERGELLARIRGNAGIRRLAGNPLLLTVLALIKRQGVELPHRRVELYARLFA